MAPVNAPRRWPNSWLSTSSRVTAEQLNGHERAALLRAVVVDEPRDDFLAGAGLAGDEDRQRSWRPAARRCAAVRSSAAIGRSCLRRIGRDGARPQRQVFVFAFGVGGAGDGDLHQVGQALQQRDFFDGSDAADR